MPQKSVNCVHQDRFGFMWFGTQDGLYRYDGYTFKYFKHDPENNNSLSNNFIWHIQEDQEGVFWISSFGGGITRFDPAQGHYKHYRHETDNLSSLNHNNTFFSLRVEDHVWVSTNDGLSCLDLLDGNVTRYLNTDMSNSGHNGNYISKIAYQEPNLLWICGDSGLISFDINTRQHKTYTNSPFGNNISLLHAQDVWVRENKLIVGTFQHLVEIDFSNSSEEILLNTQEYEELHAVRIMKFLPVDENSIVVASNSGLVFYDRSKHHFELIKYSDSDPRSLPHNHILALYVSDDGVLWIGTRNGLSKLDKINSNFRVVRRVDGSKTMLSHNSIKCLAEEGQDLLWVGTEDGLNLFNMVNGENTVFTHQPNNEFSIGDGYVLSVTKDHYGDIWIGTRSGILSKVIWDRDLPTHTIKFKNYEILERGIQSIHAKEDHLLLGTSGNSLIQFHEDSETLNVYEVNTNNEGPSHGHVFYIFEDSFENIWLGTATGGLNLFDKTTERFLYFRHSSKNPNSLINNLILCVFEDSKNQLWIGTAGGLSKFKPRLRVDFFKQLSQIEDIDNQDYFTNYTSRHGLENEIIFGILEDNNGFLWLSTNGGLAKFDPRTEKVVKTFKASDGIHSNEHNQNAFLKLSTGEMIFGGVGGFSSFSPESVEVNAFVPPVMITDIMLYNKSVPLKNEAETDEFCLEMAPFATNRVQFAYHHDVVTFEFAALSYINPEKNSYQYKLEGFDEQWLESKSNRLATYTNLDPGNYTFKVKAANNDGIWNEQGTSLQIHVEAPPWRKWYAYLSYFILVALIIYWIDKQRTKTVTMNLVMQRRIQEAKLAEREMFRKKIAQDFHDEAGNKITKINLYIEMIKDMLKEQTATFEFLEKIELNTGLISSGMRDFIWVMDPDKDTLYDTVMRLKKFGDSMFNDLDIDFTVEGLEEKHNAIILEMETRRELMQIFKEAMNNCAKYASATIVKLLIKLSHKEIQIQLKDNGIGFESGDDNIKKGYGIRFMKERAEKIGGKLSIYSQKNHGTAINLIINIPHMGD